MVSSRKVKVNLVNLFTVCPEYPGKIQILSSVIIHYSIFIFNTFLVLGCLIYSIMVCSLFSERKKVHHVTLHFIVVLAFFSNSDSSTIYQPQSPPNCLPSQLHPMDQTCVTCHHTSDVCWGGECLHSPGTNNQICNES